MVGTGAATSATSTPRATSTSPAGRPSGSRVDGENFPAGPIESALSRVPRRGGRRRLRRARRAGGRPGHGLPRPPGRRPNRRRRAGGVDRRPERARPQVAPPLHPGDLVHAGHRHQQDREADTRAPEVPLRPHGRGRDLRPGSGRARLPAVHDRRRAAARGGVRPPPGASASGTSEEAAWTCRCVPRTRPSPLEARAWLAEHGEVPPPFASHGGRGRVGPSLAGQAGCRPVGGHRLAARARRARRHCRARWRSSTLEYARSGAPQPVNRVGINLAGPTLLAHGSDGAAEEVAAAASSTPPRSGASCSASPAPAPTWRRWRRGRRRVEGGWRLTGQKVWTSYAQFARWGICLARTDPDGAQAQRGSRTSSIDMDGARHGHPAARADHG